MELSNDTERIYRPGQVLDHLRHSGLGAKVTRPHPFLATVPHSVVHMDEAANAANTDFLLLSLSFYLSSLLRKFLILKSQALNKTNRQQEFLKMAYLFI